MEKYIAYYRVSTSEQGDSGLGIDAQKTRVKGFLKGQSPEMEFTEVESGKKDDREQLKNALEACKKTGSVLVIAKLDRLSRNLTFISSLMDSKTRFVCADMPEANEFTIHIFAALAQQERKMISERTKASLQSLKERGVKLGNPNWQRDLGTPKARRAAKEAMQRKKLDNPNNKRAKKLIGELREKGMTLLSIANALNENDYKTSQGKAFTPIQVSRLI